MKLAIAFASLTLYVLQLPIEAAEAAKDAMQLQVSIETVRAYSNRAEFELSISGSTAVPLKLSRFNLVGLLRAGQFAETNKQTWSVRETRIIEQPPAPDADFNVLIDPGKTNRVRIVTRPIIRLSQKDDASNPNGLAVQIRYELSREVGAISKTTGEFSWVACKGTGMTKVQWIAGE
jgi:hypothetical protein